MDQVEKLARQHQAIANLNTPHNLSTIAAVHADTGWPVETITGFLVDSIRWEHVITADGAFALLFAEMMV